MTDRSGDSPSPAARISVVTAVYNRAATVADSLRSVRSQREISIESVVVDGASTDGSSDVAREFLVQTDKFISGRDSGLYDALNKGLRLASGDIFGFVHADDVLADEYALSRVAQAMQDPEVDLCYGDLVYVDKANLDRVIRYWRAGEYDPSKLAWGWMPPHPTVYARRSLYERVGLFDERYKIAADYDSMLRLLKAARAVRYIPQIQVKMRVGGASNRSLSNVLHKSREDFDILRHHGFGAASASVALLAKNLRKLPQFFAKP